ncbi:MAG: hypothetical protein HY291_13270 [Planctomycetes bacterium]|nr:hypothetical protein [Planctomycetota bacterium]
MRQATWLLPLFMGLMFRASAAEAPAETWVLSGQSNACGRGALPGPDADPRVKMWNGKQFVEAKEPLAGMNGQVGPWHAAATDVAKAGIPVNLAGFAQGGMPIDYWDDKKAGWTSLAAAIKGGGEGAGVFLWYQGETDGMNGMSENDYKAKLKNLTERVRTQAKSPRMLAVIVQLSLWKNDKGDFMPIREAERRFVVEDGNALLVPALGRKSGDYVHLSREGYFELGAEIARALLKNRYGKKDVNWPGPVMDAAAPGADGKTAAVHFAEVKKLDGVKAEDFGALDAGGQVKCVKAEAANTLVALTFERALKPPAKVVYGFGQNPAASLVDEAGNRAPAVQLELKAGAIPADKETQAPNGAGAK